MTDKNVEFNPRIKSRLDELKPVPPRDSRRAARTRANFLAQVAAAQPQNRSFRAIPVRILAPVMLILVLLFAGTSTVIAAQTSLPGETLYPVKIFSEEVRLSWTADIGQKVALLFDYSDIRVDEITSLALVGQVVPQSVVGQLEEQYALAFQLAAGLDDNQLSAMMAQVQTRLRVEEQKLSQTHSQMGTESEAQVLSQVREQVRVQLALAQMGQTDPQRFRHMVMNRVGQPTVTLSPIPQGTASPNTPGSNPTHGIDNGNGNFNDNSNNNDNEPGPDKSPTPKRPGGGGQNPSITPAPKTPQGPGSGAKKTPADGGSGGGGGKP